MGWTNMVTDERNRNAGNQELLLLKSVVRYACVLIILLGVNNNLKY